MNRKKRVAFERVARQYRNYQRELAMLKKEEHQQEWQTMAMQALEENIAMTERTLSQIRLKHGEKAERRRRLLQKLGSVSDICVDFWRLI